MPVRSTYRRTQVAAAAVLPTPQGYVFPAAAVATPINRRGQAPAPVDSPTQPACVFPEMVMHPMLTVRKIPALALLASPTPLGCAFRDVDAEVVSSCLIVANTNDC